MYAAFSHYSGTSLITITATYSFLSLRLVTSHQRDANKSFRVSLDGAEFLFLRTSFDVTNHFADRHGNLNDKNSLTKLILICIWQA